MLRSSNSVDDMLLVGIVVMQLAVIMGFLATGICVLLGFTGMADVGDLEYWYLYLGGFVCFFVILELVARRIQKSKNVSTIRVNNGG